MKIYQAEAMLRVRGLGGSACFDEDAAAIHVVSPGGVPAPKMGGVPVVLQSACLLIPDGVSEGVARLEQLVVAKNGSEQQLALAVLAQAEAEAVRLQQSQIVILHPTIAAAGEQCAEWLHKAGFADAENARMIKFI